MRLWSYCIAANFTDPAEIRLVLARTAEHAQQIIEHPEANVCYLPKACHGEALEALNPKNRPAQS